jgi:protocatechuate 3,4-dioxygenase beta subunit
MSNVKSARIGFAAVVWVAGLLWMGVCAGQSGGGSVSGKVVQEPGAQGIRKVVVELTATGEGDSAKEYRTATDASGAFHFEGVPPGKYTVELARAGYFAPKKSEWTVTVEAGKELSALVYKMQAAGVISGKIVDPEGDPVANVSVEAMRQGKGSAVTGQAADPVDTGRAITNDLGEYRIANLRPGQYQVRAEATADIAPAPNPADKGRQRDKAVYTKTYFPGTMEEGQAGTVQVVSGGMVAANIGLLTNRAYRVSGTVSGTGTSQMAQLVLVSRGGATLQENLDEGGKFEFQNVQPGTYEARVLIVSGVGEGQRPTMKVEKVQSAIVVDAADVTGLDLVAETGGAVKGKFRVDDDSQIDWTQMAVRLEPVPDAGAGAPNATVEALEMAGGAAQVDTEGNFEIKDVPGGTYQVAVASKSEVYRDYYTKSILESGREVVDTGFAVTGGAVLEIVVSAKGCAIEGTVVDKDGRPVTDAEVVAVPASGQRMRPDAYQSEKSNPQGQFTLRGMIPGKYVVLALENAHDDLRSPEFFAKYGPAGEQVELGEGEKKSVGLKVVEGKE